MKEKTPLLSALALPITTVAPGIVVDGPAPELADEMKALYEAKFGQ